MSFLIGGVIGFMLGLVVMWALNNSRLTTYNTIGTISLGNIECIDGDTAVSVPFTSTGGTPVEIKVQTYDSSGTEPTYEEAISVEPTSPIEVSYDPTTCQDRIIVYAAFASDPASGDIPCVGSGCSSSSADAAKKVSVLP